MTTMRFFAATGDAIARLICQDGRCDVRMSLEGSGAQCVAVDPHDPGRIFAGTFDRGLWRSRDGGETWTQMGDGAQGIAQARVLSVAVSPAHRSSRRSPCRGLVRCVSVALWRLNAAIEDSTNRHGAEHFVRRADVIGMGVGGD